MRTRWYNGAMLLAAVLACRATARADLVSWDGTTNDWNDAASWSGDVVPGPADDVTIANAGASVLLTNSVTINSLVLAKTLTCSNWNTCLNAAGRVTIANGGLLTCAGPFNNAPVMSNRVNVACGSLFVASGGSINVDSKGFAGGTYSSTPGVSTPGQGPGGGGTQYYPVEGAHHGGWGSYCRPIDSSDNQYSDQGSAPYGTPSAPEEPGSGGGGTFNYSPGRAGGGAVRIVAGGNVNVNGAISAKGGNGVEGWSWTFVGNAGSGGSIYITCDTFTGTNGTVQANGGDGNNNMTQNPNLGGGGRIAIAYNPASQAALPVPSVQIAALPGVDNNVANWPRPNFDNNWGGEIGSVWLPDTRFWSTDMAILQGHLFGPTNWSVASLTLDNRWVGFPTDGTAITIAGDVRVSGRYGGLSLGGPLATNNAHHSGHYRYSDGERVALQVGGNLIVTNFAKMCVYSAVTNATQTDYGARVAVTGDLRVETNAILNVIAHPNNGAAARFTAKNVFVAARGTISADCMGFGSPGTFANGRGYGPGGGTRFSGAGYGGNGGDYKGWGEHGRAYGATNAPPLAGSASGTYTGCRAGLPGGGLIWIEAANLLTVNGTISANGRSQYLNWWNLGGGSGGGIYLRCKQFNGPASGIVRANGGNGITAGGGGGRIVIWRQNEMAAACTASANGGAFLNADGASGSSGSVYWGLLPAAGSMVVIH